MEPAAGTIKVNTLRNNLAGIIAGLLRLVLGSWERPYQTVLIHRCKPMHMPVCLIPWELIVLVW